MLHMKDLGSCETQIIMFTLRPLKNSNFRSLRLSVRVQGRRKFQPQVPRSKCPWGKYMEYFEDSAKASLRAEI